MKAGLDIQQWLPVAILAVAGYLLYAGLTEGPMPDRPLSARNPRVQQAVNKHLEHTAEQLELQRRKMQIESTKMAMSYSGSNPTRAYVPPREGAELKHDDRMEQLAQDLGVERPRETPSNPMDMIQHQLFEEQRNRELTDAYKREYARQFIENARRGGYEVQLSDDFRVLSVKPIRRPSNGY